MAKSKRNHVVALTKTKRQTRKSKELHRSNIQAAVQSNPFLYILSLENQRNNHLKAARDQLKPGRIFYGKKKFMQNVLSGKDCRELAVDLEQFSECLHGERALLCTQLKPEEVKEFAESFRPIEFAKSGFIPHRTITIPEGFEAFKNISHSMHKQLKELGLPIVLKDAKLCMLCDWIVCREGEALTSNQAQILKHLGIRLSQFKMRVDASWTNGKTTIYNKS